MLRKYMQMHVLTHRYEMAMTKNEKEKRLSAAMKLGSWGGQLVHAASTLWALSVPQ